MEREPWRQAIGLLVLVGGCLAVGGIGGWLTADALEPWYAGLDKPSFTPPDAAFGPVWTTLYVLMGVAAWLIWRTRPWDQLGEPAAWFGGQLALNVAWSGVFFGLQSPGGALVVITALIVAIVGTMRVFYPRERWAGHLLVPYIAWVAWAAVLNASIWWMN